MNDRTMIAAMAMQGMLTNSFADDTPEIVAKGAVAYADALLKALAETDTQRPHFTTSDDHRIIVQATGLGPAEFLTPYPTPSWWGAEPEQDDSPPVVDEVGDWRKYTDIAYKRYVRQLADGWLLLAGSCFAWDATPQGAAFWAAVNNGTASAADKARAQDFARRVLEAMEEEGE